MGVGLLLMRPPLGTELTTCGASAVAFVESMRPMRFWSTAEIIGLEYTRRESAPHSGHDTALGASPMAKSASIRPCSSHRYSYVAM